MSRLVGLWASALLVVAACSSSVTIGEDDAGGGRDGSVRDGGGADSGGGTDGGADAGDAGGGEPCGDNVCGEGEYCCNASCGWCAAEGVACPAIACEPEPVYCNGERCASSTDVCCPGCEPGESSCSGPEGICPELACPPPVECPDGSACGLGQQCCPSADCESYLCRPEGEPCPAAPSCPPVECPDGSTCLAGDRCCPGCEGAFFCASGDVCPVPSCPPPPDPGCEAQQARGVGMCDAFFGYAWDGSACVPLSGCTCEGTDCGHLYETMELCVAARASCLPPPRSCDGDGECDVGEYCNPCARSSCPACDDCIAGCTPHGCVDKAPLSCRRLRPECGPDGVAIVEMDGCWQCVSLTTCDPLPPG